MTLGPTAIATARRNLAQRMERFLGSVESEARPLTQWETDLLCQALAHLENSYFRVGEDVMLYVERADLYWSPKARADVAAGPTPTVAEVLANLAKVQQGD